MRLSYILCIFLALVSCKKSNQQLTKITAKTINVSGTIQPSSEIDNMVAPFREKLTSEMQQVLCFNPTTLTKKDGEMQSTLGNLMADMCWEMGNPIFKEKTGKPIDLVLFNFGGMRASIPQGNVTTENAFKLMPFENELVVTTLTGEKITELFNYFVNSQKANPLSKSVAITIQNDTYEVEINGEKFDKTKSYSVLTSDYLQNGGDKMSFFHNPEKLTSLDYKVRDAIIDYFKKVDTLQTSLDNRVIIKK